MIVSLYNLIEIGVGPRDLLEWIKTKIGSESMELNVELMFVRSQFESNHNLSISFLSIAAPLYIVFSRLYPSLFL